MWLISTIDTEGVLSGTKVDLADGDYVRSDLAIHRCANGDDVCCERVKTSDASGCLSDKLRHLLQLLPDTLGSVERGDTTPRGCAPDLRSRLRRGREGEVTGEGKADGLPDKTLAAGSVIEDDVQTLWVDTHSQGIGRSEMLSSRATPPPLPLGIWTSRLLPWTVAYIPRASTEM